MSNFIESKEGTFPDACIVQTSTERSEVGANTPLLRSRRQTPLWRLSACTGEVYLLSENLGTCCLLVPKLVEYFIGFTYHNCPKPALQFCDKSDQVFRIDTLTSSWLV